MKNYKVIEHPMGNIIELTESDGTVRFIPADESNSDYQRYLRWLNGEEETNIL